MNKYHGFVGFAVPVETAPDVITQTIVEREYQGEIIKMSRRLTGTDKLNDDIQISNRISIISDPFAYNNFHSIRYASWLGANWKVTSVEVNYPRLILELGGVYNGQTGPERDIS